MSLLKSVATFGGLTLVSRITGFLRDMVLANFLGAGAVADAFVVAFKLPNLFRSLFAEGAFTSAFVPMFSQKLAGEGKKKAVFFAAQAIAVLTLIVGLFVLLFELIMPAVVYVIAPGFHGDKGQMALATELCRITFPFLWLIVIVSFQGGILNSFNRFAVPASAPIILNLTMIVFAFIGVVFMPSIAHSIALGITVAGVFEILWLAWDLRHIDVRIHPYIHVGKIIRNPEIKTLFHRIAPGVVGAGIYQINMAVDTILVSLVGTGAISWLYYANRLQQLPLGVIGAAIGVALLPVLSKHLKNGDTDSAKIAQDRAIEYGVMLSLPATILLIVLAEPIVRLLFQHGQFSADSALKTSYAVIAYALGLPCYVMTKALMPNFFARGDTVTPVKYSAVVFGSNFVFNVILMQFFGHVGIAMATTLSAFVSLGQYLYGLQKHGYWRPEHPLAVRLLKIAAASLIMGAAVYVAHEILSHIFLADGFNRWILFTLLAADGIIALTIFGAATLLLGVVRLQDMVKILRSRKS